MKETQHDYDDKLFLLFLLTDNNSEDNDPSYKPSKPCLRERKERQKAKERHQLSRQSRKKLSFQVKIRVTFYMWFAFSISRKARIRSVVYKAGGYVV